MAVNKQNDVFAGRYVLQELIGEGGFSEVWKAHDQMADDAVVAIKIYAPEKGLDDYGVRQFRKEFSLTHHLAHPHLMKVYHFDISDGSPYLIMPYCSHGSLARVLGEEGSFSERQVALVMCQVGSALEELHSQDPPILHQDIKPDNILVFHGECFLLADFGISSQFRHTLRKSTSSLKSLTVAYAPPERFDRHPVSDAPSDIFSLGVTLYEVCTNRIPWDGSGGQSLLKGGHVPNLPEAFPVELNNLLQACMSMEMSKRPSAAELHIRGRQFLETGQWVIPQKEKIVRKSFRNNLPPYLVAAAISLFAITSSLFYSHSRSSATNGASQKMASSFPQEERLKELEQRTLELEKENQELLQKDSLNLILLQNKEDEITTYKGKLAEKEGQLASMKSVPKISSAFEKTFYSPKELQEYLNQISNPKISKKVRSAWKNETLVQFADGTVQILDNSEGVLKQYSASIFLDLLINVPHRIVVTDIKRDHYNKITELRLSMKPNI